MGMGSPVPVGPPGQGDDLAGPKRNPCPLCAKKAGTQPQPSVNGPMHNRHICQVAGRQSTLRSLRQRRDQSQL